MRKLTERIAFTLLGITITLLALIMFAWFQTRTPRRIIHTTAQLINLKAATTNFFATAGRWPTSATELATNSLGMLFIYPSPPSRDAWGNFIIYEPLTATNGYGRFVSYGRDDKPGGIGADADIEVRFP